MELWNLRIIMVPPMLRNTSNSALQKLAKLSEIGRRPITAKDISINAAVKDRIEYLNHHRTCECKTATSTSVSIRKKQKETYHHPAISFLDEPPHSLLARYVVDCESMICEMKAANEQKLYKNLTPFTMVERTKLLKTKILVPMSWQFGVR